MGKFRYTIKDLQEYSDYKLLRAVVLDRQDSCTNIYSPLYKRLSELYEKLRRQENLSKGN